MVKEHFLKAFFVYCILVLQSLTTLGQNADSIAKDARINAVIDATLLKSTMDEYKEKGGRFLIHVVEKGESWESIAALYGIEMHDLLCMNSIHDNCFVGMELYVPVLLSDEELKEQKLIANHSGYRMAQLQLDNKDYSKAARTYTSLIESKASSTLAYFNRGVALYNDGHYKKAMSDFARVKNRGSKEFGERASKYYQYAVQRLDERREARANVFANLLNMGVQVAGGYLQAKQQVAGYTVSNVGTGNGMGTSFAGVEPGSEAYMQAVTNQNNATFNSMMGQLNGMTSNFFQYSMVQAENTIAESNERGNQCHELWVRTLGRQPTVEEDAQWWANYSQTSSLAYQNAVHKDEHVEKKVEKNGSYYEEHYGYKSCPQCGGHKKCPKCNGNKYIRDMLGNSVECPNCYKVNGRNTGECSTCFGRGEVFATK